MKKKPKKYNLYNKIIKIKQKQKNLYNLYNKIIKVKQKQKKSI